MNHLFWQILKVAPIVLATSLTAANNVNSQSVSGRQDSLNETLQQINSYQNSGQDKKLFQVTNVNQLRDVSPTDWAYEALRSLVDRYGCISGFPNQTYRGDQPLSRYEFAAGLNSCLNQIERLIASQSSVGQEDIDTINRLSQEFEAELATIGGRVDELESRTAILEDSQFSTTTVLNGETIFAIADAFGSEVGDIEDVSDSTETTFSSRVRLNFDTSFTGKDRLRTRLEGGNVVRFDDAVTGTDSTRLGFDTNNDFDIVVSDLHYRFPVNDRATAWVGPIGLGFIEIFSVNNPELRNSGDGALSRFSRRNPLIFRGTVGAGAGINLDVIEDKLALNVLYLTDDSADPSSGDGLFNGSFSAGAQVEFKPFDALALSATYVRNYQTAGTFDADGEEVIPDDINFSGSTIDGNATEPFGDDTDTIGNKIGLSGNFNVSEKIVLAAFAGYADVQGAVNGDDNNPSGEIWTWGANISFLDFGKEGSRLSFAGGMLPKFTSDIGEEEILAGVEEDPDTSYLVEALYKFPINDYIAITPGAYVVFNPDHVEDNDTVVVGVIRTTFKF